MLTLDASPIAEPPTFTPSVEKYFLGILRAQTFEIVFFITLLHQLQSHSPNTEAQIGR